MKKKFMFMHPPKPRQSDLAYPPKKILNSIDVISSLCELIFAVFNAKMSLVSKIERYEPDARTSGGILFLG